MASSGLVGGPGHLLAALDHGHSVVLGPVEIRRWSGFLQAS
jgi:hypothetical protein